MAILVDKCKQRQHTTSGISTTTSFIADTVASSTTVVPTGAILHTANPISSIYLV